jgi:hypothetical protein
LPEEVLGYLYQPMNRGRGKHLCRIGNRICLGSGELQSLIRESSAFRPWRMLSLKAFRHLHFLYSEQNWILAVHAKVATCFLREKGQDLH